MKSNKKKTYSKQKFRRTNKRKNQYFGGNLTDAEIIGVKQRLDVRLKRFHDICTTPGLKMTQDLHYELEKQRKDIIQTIIYFDKQSDYNPEPKCINNINNINTVKPAHKKMLTLFGLASAPDNNIKITNCLKRAEKYPGYISRYYGKLKDNEKDGLGIMLETENKIHQRYYIGNWKNNEYEGMGYRYERYDFLPAFGNFEKGTNKSTLYPKGTDGNDFLVAADKFKENQEAAAAAAAAPAEVAAEAPAPAPAEAPAPAPAEAPAEAPAPAPAAAAAAAAAAAPAEAPAPAAAEAPAEEAPAEEEKAEEEEEKAAALDVAKDRASKNLVARLAEEEKAAIKLKYDTTTRSNAAALDFAKDRASKILVARLAEKKKSAAEASPLQPNDGGSKKRKQKQRTSKRKSRTTQK